MLLVVDYLLNTCYNCRGYGTTNNNNPLYVIDGVQTEDPNSLRNINPKDIEKMFLKELLLLYMAQEALME